MQHASKLRRMRMGPVGGPQGALPGAPQMTSLLAHAAQAAWMSNLHLLCDSPCSYGKSAEAVIKAHTAICDFALNEDTLGLF